MAEEDRSEAEYNLSQDVADDIAVLIKDAKVEVKRQALGILLQCSASYENRILFENSDVISSLVKNIGDEVI